MGFSGDVSSAARVSMLPEPVVFTSMSAPSHVLVFVLLMLDFKSLGVSM